jgi:diguanylate cyclase (GGDEF)-like protein
MIRLSSLIARTAPAFLLPFGGNTASSARILTEIVSYNYVGAGVTLSGGRLMIEAISHTSAATATPTGPTGLHPYSKRQQVMQELIGDSDLLLKNRLEVRHLMTRDLVTIQASMTIEEMSDLMRERRLHHLLVCNRAGELVGVVSDRDLRTTRGNTAQQLMSYPPMTCASDTPITAAITFLTNENISCLPVVDRGRLCGVLTTTDLVLTLQCTLQLWMRLAQVLQQDPKWAHELEKIAASLDGDLTAEELATRIKAARWAIHQEIEDIINVIDLRTDGLTGVSNRQELEEVLGMLLAVRTRYERPFSLAIISVDHYKRIRESCGDAVVKPLLKAVARVIDEHIRTSDYVARCRDDAFAVILTETRLQEAEGFRRRLLQTAHDKSTFDTTLRISVHAVEAKADETVAELLARAEVTEVREAGESE